MEAGDKVVFLRDTNDMLVRFEPGTVIELVERVDPDRWLTLGPHPLKEGALIGQLVHEGDLSPLGENSSAPVRVYVAGPYSIEPALWTAMAIEAGNRLLEAGYAPFVPHLAHYWDRLHYQHDYDTWLHYGLTWLEACRAVVRLPGKSPGADREMARAAELDIPIYAGVDHFLREWGRR
jgi:hypothetical protein